MTWTAAFADIGGHDLGSRGAGKLAPITMAFLKTIEKY